jgi:hypothetical protein
MSIASIIAHGERHRHKDICVGIADNVTAIRILQPARLTILPFQDGMRAAIAFRSL